MIYPSIPPFDVFASNQARNRQGILTKPLGSLGILEDLSVQLAGITGKERPSFQRKAIITMAADHGIVSEGISAYPAEVTPQMVFNILNGGAAINVLAQMAGAQVRVVDIGVAYDFQNITGLIHRKIAFGTMNMLEGPALTRSQAEQAIQIGIEVIQSEINNGLDLVATGDMGIGNTTASSAITAVFTGLPVAQVTGRGTGLDDKGLCKKVELIEEAIRINDPDPKDAMDVLIKVGGLEIAGLVGVILGAAAQRVPVVVDGFISGAAALVAAEMVPTVKRYLIASHQSVEIGHQAIWNQLGLHSLLDLGLRLGEGTGSALAFHLVEAASRILDEMTTFSEAGVSNKK